MSIFKISEDYYRLMHKLEEQDGIMTPEDEQALEINQEELSEKLHRYHDVKLKIKYDIEYIKDKKKALDANIEQMDKFNKRINKYILDAVDLFGTTSKASKGKTIKYPDLTVFTKSMKRLVFENEEYFYEFHILGITDLINELLDKNREFNIVEDRKELESNPFDEANYVNINFNIACSYKDIADVIHVLRSEYLERCQITHSVTISKSTLLETVTAFKACTEEDLGVEVYNKLETLLKGVSVNENADIVVMR